MKMNLKRSLLLLTAAFLFSVFAAGCNAEAAVHTETYSTVTFMLGDRVLSTEKVSQADHPAPPTVEVEGLTIIGWEDGSGNMIEPGKMSVVQDYILYAVIRPVIKDTGCVFLNPDENGFLRPNSQLTEEELYRAACAVTGNEYILDSLFSEEQDHSLCSFAKTFRNVVYALFMPEEALRVLNEVLPADAETVTRTDAARVFQTLLGNSAEPKNYYPDVSPMNPYAAELLLSAEENTLSPEDILSQSKDGFLWENGYLYALNEDGYFRIDENYNGLYFNDAGQYTCGNDELDGFVAATVAKYYDPSQSRLDNLHTLYYHIKNDFRYLPRNYYESGAVGWDVDEALTLFRTGKGNCYCYAGGFCALARGLGYNAVTYSGTMGMQNQPHAWTEILLDGETYICDPEIEMNYWLLAMYTDNFMMKLKYSLGWNYQAVGRN